jgi:hypothetical protein
LRNISSYDCNVIEKYINELDSNSYVRPNFYWMIKYFVNFGLCDSKFLGFFCFISLMLIFGFSKISKFSK